MVWRDLVCGVVRCGVVWRDGFPLLDPVQLCDIRTDGQRDRQTDIEKVYSVILSLPRLLHVCHTCSAVSLPLTSTLILTLLTLTLLALTFLSHHISCHLVYSCLVLSSIALSSPVWCNLVWSCLVFLAYFPLRILFLLHSLLSISRFIFSILLLISLITFFYPSFFLFFSISTSTFTFTFFPLPINILFPATTGFSNYIYAAHRGNRNVCTVHIHSSCFVFSSIPLFQLLCNLPKQI